MQVYKMQVNDALFTLEPKRSEMNLPYLEVSINIDEQLISKEIINMYMNVENQI